MSQLVIAEVNSGNRINAILASTTNYATRIRGSHSEMKCDLKGTKQIVRIVFGWPTNRNINTIYNKNAIKAS